MGISLRSEHLKRYAQIARLMMKYGRSDLVRTAGLDEAITEEDAEIPEGAAPDAAEFAADLERLGPTFIKLGQLLSTRVDLLPLPYTEALTRLQDDVEPFPFAEVEEILTAELGVRPSKVFLELDSTPLAAASLGQVHRATLRDGRRVAIKVQRPGIRTQVVEDLDAMEQIAEFLDRHTQAGQRYEFSAILHEMRTTLLNELDYRREAANLITLGHNLAEFDRLVVPAAIEDLSTSRVLTMEYVRGRKVTSISPLARLEMDGEELGEQLFRAYLKQILVDGFFHADPHPGNVFLTDDRRIALLDVGMVGRLTPELQDQLMQLLLSITDRRGEEAAKLLVQIGEPLNTFNERMFERQISDLVIRHYNASASQVQLGRVMIDLTRAATENGLRLPPQLTTLGKTLLNLDQVGRTLDPDFEPNAAIRRHASELMQRRLRKNASPAQLFSTMLEMNEFVQHLPARLNRVLDAVAESEVEVQVRIANEAVLMGGLQKVANRIALALVLAALIIGAAMLVRVQTSFRIFGYPGLAIILFLAAACGGFIMAFDILRHDWYSDRRLKRRP